MLAANTPDATPVSQEWIEPETGATAPISPVGILNTGMAGNALSLLSCNSHKDTHGYS